ncbi:uncharacterized protein LOC110628756 isoform X3 [Manihot esculenta]|uniref:G domain-containing protein n=1 Tax=Manihot esculenta TaxID=3983 RepID=A0A2C9UTV2_MANES|nr:uncharacterized protein LOC110628756 isoform X3 [Manihot esculenta]OAY34813.1 hypothetical protein MANES_12G049300v8 [Manihot esculenta]
MGGDTLTPRSSSPEEESWLLDQDVSQSSSSLHLPYHPRKQEVETVNEECGFRFGGFEEEVGRRNISTNSLELEINQRNRCKAFKEVLQSYDQLQSRTESLKEAKSKILSYRPGEWIDKAGSMNLSDYNVPKTTTLLLVGSKGSGKSSLVNRISKVFDDDKFAPERAQVSYNYSAGEGTYFLREYMIPRGSSSICIYDTRSLSDDSSDNIAMLKNWITKGVRHGELLIRPSDNSSLRTRMKCKVRKNGSQSKEAKMVNFVIFVVNGIAVLKSMDSEDEGKKYTQMIATTFNCPYLSFKDDKPVVVITHGDLLSLSDRARVRVQLGELLGIPPAKQIFDIPESCDPVTELTIIDMLRYSLEHADKNLPHRHWLAEKVCRCRASLSPYIYVLIILGIAIISITIKHMHIRHASKSKPHVDWHAIRHLWLD